MMAITSFPVHATLLLLHRKQMMMADEVLSVLVTLSSNLCEIVTQICWHRLKGDLLVGGGFNFKGRLRSNFYNVHLRKGLHTLTHRRKRIGNSKKYKTLLTFSVLKEN